MSLYKVLLVEDDPQVRTLVKEVLGEEGYNVEHAKTLKLARERLDKDEFDLVLLDRTLPDGDGLDLCAEIRQGVDSEALPILFMTARNTVEDKVQGLRSGGDDYITKPFDAGEMLARIEALLRRSGRLKIAKIIGGGIEMDLEARKLTIDGKPAELWAKEFDLLAMLISQKNRVLSRDFLLQQIWGYSADSTPSTKVVDVTISHLRAKIGVKGDKVATVRGFGYRFDE